MNNVGARSLGRYISAIQWFIPPKAQRSPALHHRAQNLINAVVMATLSGPIYALVYYKLGYPGASIEILLCCSCMFMAPAVLRATGSMFLARELFLGAAFFNFAWLSYHLGGVTAPTANWLITPPIVAMLIGGVGTALFWLGMSCVAIAAMYALPLMGVALPPHPIKNMALLQLSCELGLLVVVVIFVLLFELTRTQGFIKLEKALNLINELAIRDDLTGTHNRRHLIELIERERERHARAGGPFCICLLDIDFFKRINDTYGHSAGDIALRQFALAVQHQVRDTDSFGRYGGEEFLLMMPETALAEAAVLVERIRLSVEGMTCVDIAAQFALTVSIGVAQFCNGESIGRTIARADEALYRAKSGGRNRVACDGQAAPAPNAPA